MGLFAAVVAPVAPVTVNATAMLHAADSIGLATISSAGTLPVEARAAFGDEICFTCVTSVLDCPGYHYNIDGGDADIWQGDYHGLSCYEGNCSSHHSWYYDCGDTTTCGGGLCYPTVDSLAAVSDADVRDAVLMRLVKERPERFAADPERNIVLGMGCDGGIAVRYRVKPETARRVMKMVSPELWQFFRE
jgi:hypothetical protein